MAYQDPFDRFRVRAFRLPGWQVAIIATVALALLVTLAIVATTIFLIVFPIVFLAGLAMRLLGFGRRKPVGKPDFSPGRERITVIDADYEVVSEKDRNRRS